MENMVRIIEIGSDYGAKPIQTPDVHLQRFEEEKEKLREKLKKDRVMVIPYLPILTSITPN